MFILVILYGRKGNFDARSVDGSDNYLIRSICSICLGDGCCLTVCYFLDFGGRRTFDAEYVVGMTSGLRERLFTVRYPMLCHQMYSCV